MVETTNNYQLDPLQPSAALLCKMASILIHADETFSPKGHPYDQKAMMALLRDPEVEAWIKDMTQMGMAPVKR